MGLHADPFTWRPTKDGRVRVFRGGRQVATIAGARAERFLALARDVDEDTVQHALARLTGNYRRGNERRRGAGAVGDGG